MPLSWASEFVELNKEIHDRASFDCGEHELNTFIKTQASRHMDVGISKTMLLRASNPLPNGKYSICSFFTVTPGTIKKSSLPEVLSKKLPHYPVPVFILAQMAVHLDFRGQGLGKITLVKALEYLWKVNYRMRAYAIIVDCLNKDVEQFYSKYGFEILCIHNGKTRMFLPMKTVGKLFE